MITIPVSYFVAASLAAAVVLLVPLAILVRILRERRCQNLEGCGASVVELGQPLKASDLPSDRVFIVTAVLRSSKPGDRNYYMRIKCTDKHVSEKLWQTSRILLIDGPAYAQKQGYLPEMGDRIGILRSSRSKPFVSVLERSLSTQPALPACLKGGDRALRLAA